MKKLIGWILGASQVGKAVKKAQGFLDGKKLLITGLATAIPATLMIISNFANETDGGLPYLMSLPQKLEFQTAAGGWGMVFAAMKGEKIRQENAEIIEKIDSANL